MTDLSGQQIEIFRIGLMQLFPEQPRLERFLRERLEKALNHYVGFGDSLPDACFRVILSAQAEGWINDLCKKANEFRPQNRNIALIASELDLPLVSNPTENPTVQSTDDVVPTPFWRCFNPFRGLLALREQDADFLFGRDADVDTFIEAIATHSSKIFLALGASGVGKSSLIFAGVLGALNRRALKGRKPWPIALEDSHKWPHLVLTPGKEPVRSLAGAFAREWLDATTPDYQNKISDWQAFLVEGGRFDGLVEAADEAWRRKLRDPPPRYLIYIDQGEELYTRAGRDPGRDPGKFSEGFPGGSEQETMQQKEARRFSELLAEAAAHSRFVVLMSTRSDFLGRLQADKRLSEDYPELLFDVHHQINISPLGESGLIDVVSRSAEVLGVSFETGLDKALIAATRKEIGGLPLLSYTLETLWQEMQNADDASPVIRWSGTAGEPIDITRKLAERADAFLARYKGQEEVIRRLFCVRLAHVPHLGEPTRQAALLSELSDAEGDLVKSLADSRERILTTGQSDNGQAIAEVAHEKLFIAWTTLRNWIESRRVFYAWVTQVATDRQAWEKVGYPSEHLLVGRPLERARFHLEHDEEDIPPADKRFVTASINADNQRRAKEAERERKIAQRTVAGLIAACVLAIAATGAGLYANHQREEAQQYASHAVTSLNDAHLTQSRFLTEQSNQATDRGDAATGILLALEALPDARSNLKTTRERPYWGPAEIALEKARRSLRERRVLAGHEASLTSVAVTPNGRIVTGSADKTARIWDAASGRELLRLEGHQGSITGVAALVDGRIVTSSEDKTVRIWDATSGRELVRLEGHQRGITSMAVMPNGRIVTGSWDKTARIWDATNGRELVRLEGHKAVINSVALTADGTRIVTGAGDSFVKDNTARLWDAANGRELALLEGHQDNVTSVAITPDGARIVTGSHDETARLWDAASGRELVRFEGHQGNVVSVAITPDGARIVTDSLDGTSRIWDAASGRELAKLQNHKGWTTQVAETPDAARIVTDTVNGISRIWDPVSGRELAKLKDFKLAGKGVAVTPDGARIVTTTEDKTARIWEVASGGDLARLDGHHDEVWGVAVTPDSTRIVTGSHDKTVRIWDAASGREIAKLEGHQGQVMRVALTPDGRRIITGSWDKTARVWDAASGRELARLEGHQGRVYSVAVTPDGARIVTGSEDKTIRVWDAASGRELAKLEGHLDIVTSVAVTPDGTRFVSGSNDKTARIWDAVSGRELAKLEGHQGWVWSVCVTPDGARIVTGSADKTVRIWDAANGHELARLQGHEGIVNSVAVTPDGTRIVTGSTDHTVRFWDVASGRELATLRGRQRGATSDAASGVTSVAVTPDGARIVFGLSNAAIVSSIFPYGQILIEDAKFNVPRCLKPGDRKRYFLSSNAPSWCYEMGKWPYTPIALMVEGKSLLGEAKRAEAQNNFVDAEAKFANAQDVLANARRLAPPLSAEIDKLLAEAHKPSEIR